MLIHLLDQLHLVMEQLILQVVYQVQDFLLVAVVEQRQVLVLLKEEVVEMVVVVEEQ